MFLSATVLPFPLVYGLPFHASCLSPCHSYPFNLSFLCASLVACAPFSTSLFYAVPQHQMLLYTWRVGCVLSCLCFWPELLGEGPLRSRKRPQQRQMKSKKSAVRTALFPDLCLSSGAASVAVSICCCLQSFSFSEHEPSQKTRFGEKGIPPSLLNLVDSSDIKILCESSQP